MTERNLPNCEDGFRKGVAMDVAIWAERHNARPGLRFFLRHLALRPGFYFAFGHRCVRLVRRVPVLGAIIGRFLTAFLELAFSSEIAVSAQFGGGLYVPHPFGIVIGDKCKIGRNVTILQNVTFGNRSLTSPAQPYVEDDAYIGAGAVVLGEIAVGNGAMVGANAVVLSDVPPQRVAVGNPARLAPPRQ